LFNHPDDTGEETSSQIGAAARSTTTTAGPVPGLSDVPARYKLVAFVSHKGPSVHSGHYVAHIRKGAEGDWVLFNDEKVVKADAHSVDELKRFAYLYFFVRM
jgi:ubiquitin carboxyl-terminal hydrolase 5/13